MAINTLHIRWFDKNEIIVLIGPLWWLTNMEHLVPYLSATIETQLARLNNKHKSSRDLLLNSPI